MSIEPQPATAQRSRPSPLLGLLLAFLLVPALVAQYWMFERQELLSLYLGAVFVLSGSLAIKLVRRQAALNAALRGSEERLRSVIERTHDAFIAMDQDGRIVEWNPRAEETFGWRREEALGRSVAELIIPERLREAHRQGLSRFLATGKAKVLDQRLELGALHKDGHELAVELSISAVRDGSGYRFNSFLREITARKQAEQEAERHRQELQTLLDSMSTMVATVARDGRLLLVNRIAEMASGLPRAELLQTNFLEGQWWGFDPVVQARVREAFGRACAGTPVSYDESILVFGEVHTISFGLTPVTGPDGRVAYVVAEGRDVTPLKAAEQQLRERSLELEALNRELEAFSYSVSHDLRAPLRHVAGFSRVLEDDHAAALDETARGHLRRIVEGAAHMGNLIDGLLNLSRLGRRQLERRPTDLGALVEEVRHELEVELKERRIEWKLERLPVVECDRSLMRQVFVNLLANAIKYSRPRALGRIEVGTRRLDRATVFYVRDNGVGFDMQYAHKLFGVFQRLHGVTEFEGTGIGLATVQRIVHRHGGRIWAEAKEGEGATFYFTLEALAEAAATSLVAAGEERSGDAQRDGGPAGRG